MESGTDDPGLDADPTTPPKLVPSASVCPRVCGQARGPARRTGQGLWPATSLV